MLINKLLQDVQSCFRNPFSTDPDPILSVITRLYRENRQFILESPVSVSHGYGAAIGKKGTFKERIERFIRIMGVSSDTLKALYTANVSEVSSLLFLYEIGSAGIPIEKRHSCENDPSKLDICGQSVQMIQNAAISENLGISINTFIGYVIALHKRLSGVVGLLPTFTEVILAENIIRMDRQAIDSIKARIDAGN